ncbi:hypothetical protein LY76DRAFT_631686 [Colletotrichum caudatum]|nr:hypothetical protein LY76DRAFT_631686 [Colletotrichum caudatum]
MPTAQSPLKCQSTSLKVIRSRAGPINAPPYLTLSGCTLAHSCVSKRPIRWHRLGSEAVTSVLLLLGHITYVPSEAEAAVGDKPSSDRREEAAAANKPAASHHAVYRLPVARASSRGVETSDCKRRVPQQTTAERSDTTEGPA